ncbi:MAG: penicillin acylase family protein [Haloarculaceae archaeon]
MQSESLGVAVTLVCAALLVTAATVAGGFVSLAAPVSGEAWGPAYGANDGSLSDRLARAATGPTEVENPYGTATVRYDDHGVPHVTAENTEALYFAVGYVHARDRLFQMDLQRRLMAGNLSAAFGERTVESDRFHRKMAFDDAAEASWEAVEGSEAGAGVRAYTDGVNRYIDGEPLPLEFRLNDYRPTRWEPTDTLLVGKLISWQLTGDFRDLRGRVVQRRLPEATSLYPRRLDHDDSILGRADLDGSAGSPGVTADVPSPDAADTEAAVGDLRGLYDSLRPHQRSPGIGSNSWVVSGEYTASGDPILANDPHLSLTVPPVWYEQHLVVTGEASMDVRGVALPGQPAVVIGQNRNVAWGFTNVGADQTDLYSYDRPSEDTYRYRGEEREIRRSTETVPVSGGQDVEVTVERTVHGPLIEREGGEVAVAWLGLAGTRELQAVHRLNRAGSIEAVDRAMRRFDSPTQNFVAMDADGGTYFRLTGRYPIRTVDGERVRGDRVFDGSAGHGEWAGWEPYEQADWNGSGFVPYEDVPHAVDPGYVATANQRTTDDPPFYIGSSTRYADPYRGKRIYDRIDRRVGSGEPVTVAWTQDLQRDVRSEAAAGFVPHVLNATDEMSPEARAAARTMDGWDYRMDRDSEAALYFALFGERIRNATFHDEFHPAGLDAGYYPHLWTVGELPADSRWFDDTRTPERETRADIVARAFERAVAEAERGGYGTYGDYNVVDLDHQFPVAALDYPEAPTDGSPFTVFNFRTGTRTQAGSSWRMVATTGDDSVGVIPGGQSGVYYSPHYRDQFDEWREGEYRPIPLETTGRTVIVFENERGGEDA